MAIGATGKDEDIPLKSIDWGPDPEPVYSSTFNRSRELSRSEMKSFGSMPDMQALTAALGKSTLDQASEQPYMNLVGDGERSPPLIHFKKEEPKTAQ